ncbi:hypothetical protein K449DRAFT_433515 [Hypoxylon sp. EC38]|nr:hypothetical protein K449DRAFT_433515 [Hypoxylon sp. EC38]
MKEWLPSSPSCATIQHLYLHGLVQAECAAKEYPTCTIADYASYELQELTNTKFIMIIVSTNKFGFIVIPTSGTNHWSQDSTLHVDSMLDLSTLSDSYVTLSILTTPDNRVNVLRLYRGLTLAYLDWCLRWDAAPVCDGDEWELSLCDIVNYTRHQVCEFSSASSITHSSRILQLIVPSILESNPARRAQPVRFKNRDSPTPEENR